MSGWEPVPSDAVTHKATRRFKCVACGKRVTRTRTFEATAGAKTRSEIRQDLIAEAVGWEPKPVCTACDIEQAITFFEDGTLLRHHSFRECSGRCPLHFPTQHHMRTWRMNWRPDRGIMERICTHGVGHPDPDGRRIWLGEDSGVHGCDGCCRPGGVGGDTSPEVG